MHPSKKACSSKPVAKTKAADGMMVLEGVTMDLTMKSRLQLTKRIHVGSKFAIGIHFTLSAPDLVFFSFFYLSNWANHRHFEGYIP